MTVTESRPTKRAPSKYWRKIAKGIHQHKITGAFRVRWMGRVRQEEKPFPPDTPIKFLIAFRKQQLGVGASAKKKESGGGGGSSFARDIVRYLRTIKHRVKYGSERSHLKAWLKVHKGSRFTLTDKIMVDIRATWEQADPPPAPRTIKHRINALRQFFKYHDGKGFISVAHTADKPAIPKTAPKLVPGGNKTIRMVIDRLEQQELNGRLRDGKTRARFAVLATCGKRPCQVMAAKPADVNLKTRLWNVVPAKHSNGGPLWLNDDMLAAWKLFVAANAWGRYDSRSFSKTLKRNGWPDGVRPYNMRHQFVNELDHKDVAPRRIQQAVGHDSLDTTDTFYLQKSIRGSRLASQAINGRFKKSKGLFTPRKKQKYDKKKSDQHVA